MRFTIATVFTTLAIGAIAAPGALPAGPGFGDITVGQAGDRCGENLELNCCNEVRQSGDDIDYADGILSGLLADGLLTEGLGLFKGCSKLTVTARKWPCPVYDYASNDTN